MSIAALNRDDRRLDWTLILTVVAIALGGVLAIQSAMHGDPASAGFYRKQLLGVAIGLTAMLAVALSDYSALLPRISKPLSWINVGLLLVVLKLGHSAKGAQRWIPLGPVQFQPSEFAKIAIIVALAVYVARRGRNITEFRTVLGSLGVIAIPFALIFKQPDLGTGLVLLTIWLGVLFVAGARLRQIGAILLVGLAVFAGLWHVGKIKGYQKQRLTAFINPAADQRETGYHLRQSQIAIGAGQLTGQGYGQGLQETGHFIPEQRTDFIFTVVGEEGGFAGAVFLLLLYLLALQRCVAAIIATSDYFGRLIAAGVVAMLAFHIIVNIGMTIGVMPVTGVPLPFFSYGLSALIVDMAAVGLVLSVARRSQGFSL
jgi:rod shape determining protein RodA